MTEHSTFPRPNGTVCKSHGEPSEFGPPADVDSVRGLNLTAITILSETTPSRPCIPVQRSFVVILGGSARWLDCTRIQNNMSCIIVIVVGESVAARGLLRCPCWYQVQLVPESSSASHGSDTQDRAMRVKSFQCKNCFRILDFRACDLESAIIIRLRQPIALIVHAWEHRQLCTHLSGSGDNSESVKRV